MPDMGFGEWLVWLVVVTATIAVPALIIGLAIRFAHIGRDDPRRVLRRRLARGEITPAESEMARRALGR